MKEYSRQILRANEVADLDPYGVRGTSVQASAAELLAPPPERKFQEFSSLEGYFNTQQNKILFENHYKRFQLKGLTVKEIIDRHFFNIEFHDVFENMDEIMKIKSMKGEVALKTNKTGLYLPDSGAKNYFEQLLMANVYQNEVVSPLGITGVTTILGNLADYLDLASVLQNLFGEKYDYGYAITNGIVNHPKEGKSALAVGSREGATLHVLSHTLDYERGDIVYVAPLITPFRANIY